MRILLITILAALVGVQSVAPQGPMSIDLLSWAENVLNGPQSRLVLSFTYHLTPRPSEARRFNQYGFIINKSARKAYKVMYQAKSWIRAREECQKMGASLAVPKTLEEFQFLQKLVRGMSYPQVTGTSYKLLVWLGISNIEDYSVWKNVDGEDIRDTGFSEWASSNVANSADPAEPHCVGMDAVNPGLRDYWCHLREPYICQIKVASYGRPDYNNINEAIEHFMHEQFIFQDR